MTEKIEIELTFNDFANKNKSVLELKQSRAINYQNLLTAKAVQEQTKDIGFSDDWKRELSNKIDELQPKAEEELKEASENINKYLFQYTKAVFEYHKPVIETPKDEYIKEYSKKIRGLIAAGSGQLDPETIFNMVKVLYINTESKPSGDIN